MGNKVKYNLRNVHYAPITAEAEGDGFPTYGTPVAIPGAVELSMEQQGSIKKFYADGIVFWQAAKNNGYEGDLTLALVPDHFRVACLGEELNTDKVYVEKATAKGKGFALLFEFDGDATSTRHVLWNCTAALANGYVKARTGDETTASVVSGWYQSVYTPTAAA